MPSRQSLPVPGTLCDTAASKNGLPGLYCASAPQAEEVVATITAAGGEAASFLGRLTSEEAQHHYERYIGPYFTSNVARHAVDAVDAELGVPRQPSPRQPLTRCTCRP